MEDVFCQVLSEIYCSEMVFGEETVVSVQNCQAKEDTCWEEEQKSKRGYLLRTILNEITLITKTRLMRKQDEWLDMDTRSL